MNVTTFSDGLQKRKLRARNVIRFYNTISVKSPNKHFQL